MKNEVTAALFKNWDLQDLKLHAFFCLERIRAGKATKRQKDSYAFIVVELKMRKNGF